MRTIKESSKIEYTTKEMLGYFLMAYKKVQENREERLADYIRELMCLLKSIDKNKILDNIDVSLIANYYFNHLVNCDELMCYGLVVFYRLLNSNKDIKERDIISQLETEMRLFSARTIIIEAENILNKLQK